MAKTLTKAHFVELITYVNGNTFNVIKVVCKILFNKENQEKNRVQHHGIIYKSLPWRLLEFVRKRNCNCVLCIVCYLLCTFMYTFVHLRIFFIQRRVFTAAPVLKLN